MTGQAQGIGYTQDQFKDEVCKHILGLLDCQNGVYVDVQSYSSFGSVAIIDPVADGKFVPTTVYKPGNACDVVVVRLFYQWPLFVVGLGYDMKAFGRIAVKCLSAPPKIEVITPANVTVR